MKNYRELINTSDVPRHIAIIMDGNGRWAKKRSLPRSEGHKRGSEVVEPVVDAAMGIGVRAVSLFAFSTENWNRPLSEIRGLWDLLEYFFTINIEKIRSKGVRVMHSGSTAKLPASTRRVITDAIDSTQKNKKLILNICLNYGGRQEIVDSVNQWLENRKRNEKLTQKKLEKKLYTAAMPEIDLMIRTSGEYRISNFMLWQLAYSELVFTDVLWPDFRPAHLYRAVYQYQQRDRRFGGL